MFLEYFNLIVFYSLRAFCAQPSSFLLHILVDSFSEIKFPNIILWTSLRTSYYPFITWYTQTQLILVDPYPFIILLSCWLQKLTYLVSLYIGDFILYNCWRNFSLIWEDCCHQTVILSFSAFIFGLPTLSLKLLQ